MIKYIEFPSKYLYILAWLYIFILYAELSLYKNARSCRLYKRENTHPLLYASLMGNKIYRLVLNLQMLKFLFEGNKTFISNLSIFFKDEYKIRFWYGYVYQSVNSVNYMYLCKAQWATRSVYSINIQTKSFRHINILIMVYNTWTIRSCKQFCNFLSKFKIHT